MATLSGVAEDDNPTRQGPKVRERVEQFLRDEDKLNDQRKPRYRGGGKGRLGAVTRENLLRTSDLNPTADEDD